MEPTKQNSDEQKATISRQEALRKMGKYAAATAAGTFILLNPKQAKAEPSGLRPGGNPTEEAEYNNSRSGAFDHHKDAASSYRARSKTSQHSGNDEAGTERRSR